LHYYFYDFQSVSAYLYFSKDYKGKVEFNQAYTAVNATPPQVRVDMMRPVMRELERKLEADCGLQNLVMNIEERCSGVKCSK